MKIERLKSSRTLSTMANFSPVKSFDSQCGPRMRYERYNTMNIIYINPVFLRSSGVRKAYITLRNMSVEKRAYSISFVALNAMNMRDVNRNTLLSKSTRNLSGIWIAFPEKRPWYKMMREKTIGWVRTNTSAGFVTGLNRLASFTIYVT